MVLIKKFHNFLQRKIFFVFQSDVHNAPHSNNNRHDNKPCGGVACLPAIMQQVLSYVIHMGLYTSQMIDSICPSFSSTLSSQCQNK